MSKCKLIMLISFAVFLYGCQSMEIRSAADKGLSSGDYETAAANYKILSDQQPYDWKLKIRLGFSYIKAKRYDEALSVLNEIKGADAEPWAIYYKGYAYLNKGERQNAIDIWKTYKNRLRSDVERLISSEIKRQKTMIAIEESEEFARQAVENEKAYLAKKPQKNTFAVLYYKNLSEDSDMRAIQKALNAMIISDLSKIKSIRIVERVKMQALVNEMTLAEAGITVDENAPKIGKILQAEKILTGTIAKGSIKTVNTVASVVDKKDADTFALDSEESEFFDLEKAIVKSIVKSLGIVLTPEEEKMLGEYYTKNFTAFKYYGNALDSFDNKDFDKAMEFFSLAIKEDAGFSLAQEGLDSSPSPSTESKIEILGMPKANSQCGN